MTKLNLDRKKRILEAEEKGHKENPPSSENMKPNSRSVSAKDVKGKLKTYSDKSSKVKDALPKPTSSSKAAIPDATKVKRSDAEALKFKPSSESIPNVGQIDKIKGQILKGLSDSAIKKCEIKVAPAIPTPETGFGLLKTASSNKKQENDAKVPSISIKGLVEGVINGRTKVFVGRSHKMTLEAANVGTIRSIVEGYTGVGRKVKVSVEPGTRKIFTNNAFTNLMMEAAHYDHHSLESISESKKNKAFKIFKRSLANEYVSFYHGSRKEWVKESVLPAFKQVGREFNQLYQNLLEDYEVSVRIVKNKEEENVKLITKAINENCAAANAFDEIEASDGLGTHIKHAYVGAKKYLPESENKSPLTSIGKFFVDDLSKVDMAVKSSDGQSSSVKGDKPAKMKEYKGTAKGVTKTKVRKNINPESFVKKEGGPRDDTSIPAHVTKGTQPLPDSGPIYETMSFDPETLLKRAAESVSSKRVSRVLSSISEKLSKGKDLTEKEEGIVDKVMDVAMTKALA